MKVIKLVRDRIGLSVFICDILFVSFISLGIFMILAVLMILLFQQLGYIKILMSDFVFYGSFIIVIIIFFSIGILFSRLYWFFRHKIRGK